MVGFAAASMIGLHRISNDIERAKNSLLERCASLEQRVDQLEQKWSISFGFDRIGVLVDRLVVALCIEGSYLIGQTGEV